MNERKAVCIERCTYSLVGGRWKRANLYLASGLPNMFVPVVDQDQHPLMPTTPARAKRWIKSGKATHFWKGGLFCVRLNGEPSGRRVQPIAVGIDPWRASVRAIASFQPRIPT